MSLRIEQDGRVRRITLAAPAKRNVMDATLASELLREVADAFADSGTGAILLDAEGQVFCAGVNGSAPLPDELFTLGRNAAKPVIVAVQGVAISAGLALVANAHVAVAAQGSSFGLTDVREGRCYLGLIQAVADAIGARRARELALTGRIFSTPEALDWGLIQYVAPAFELDDRATAIATALSEANPLAIQAILGSLTRAQAG
jgi:enoyl-CoA hydratase/carnithine racemase